MAGQCHCKENVGGPRCDRCKNGYWNFTLENEKGCQGLYKKVGHQNLSLLKEKTSFALLFFLECTCNIAGIVSDAGCDEETGECTCKRYVTNRDCDQCLPEHYGLSQENEQGCTPCDCDIGGSYDNNCDVDTGQCKCRPHINGRRCDEIEDEYFTGSLDFLIFEGENALGSRNPVSVNFLLVQLNLTEDLFSVHYGDQKNAK